MDYISFCKNFFAATNIPISLLKNGTDIYSALGDMLSANPQTQWELFPIEQNPIFCSYSPDLEYGRIHIDNTDYDVVLGPAFNVPVTEQIVRQFMHELTISSDYHEQLMEYFSSIPRISHLQFAKYLSFLYQCLNGKEADLMNLYLENDLYDENRNKRQIGNRIEDMENENHRSSYVFEIELYQYIKDGNVKRLKEFLRTNSVLFKEGKMAHTPLRHAKNVFISTVSKAALIGAIPGGLDIEKGYQLIDFYVQECEQLRSIEEITNLQYMMLIDFCQRAGETHLPDGVSPEVYLCMNYIRSHTNEPISVDDVARQVHRSSSHMMRRFKEELGIHIGAFITRCKLEEAKSLLTFTDKSLAEIASYLCFSSQSYFQNVFKKQYGITPMKYRKETQAHS
ncbi:MAG: AraC family transcriptional regulator [Eubacterium sp.]|nr:AraC family transcriptional regulator [Eubacterium sp.]